MKDDLIIVTKNKEDDGLPNFRGRPKTGKPMMNKNKNKNKPAKEIEPEETNKKQFLEILKTSNAEGSISDLEDIEPNKVNYLSTKEKLDLLENQLGDQKGEFESMLKEERERLASILPQKEKLNSINLIENHVEHLYEWKALFNTSRPISAYTRPMSYKIPNDGVMLGGGSLPNSNSSTDDGKKEMIFPVALIDAPEELIRDFVFQKSIPTKKLTTARGSKLNSAKKDAKKIEEDMKQSAKATQTISLSQNASQENKNTSKNFNVSAKNFSKSKSVKEFPKKKLNGGPRSVFSPREDNEVFYFSKAFSDYYTEDFNDFVKKFPLIQAKVRCRQKSLQKTLSYVRKHNVATDRLVKSAKDQMESEIRKNDWSLAGNARNIRPLLRSVFRQIYPNTEEELEPKIRHYPQSNKPLGNPQGVIDNTINVRGKNLEEITRRCHKSTDDVIEKLNLETYNEDDPQIQILKEENIAIHEENLSQVKEEEILAPIKPEDITEENEIKLLEHGMEEKVLKVKESQQENTNTNVAKIYQSTRPKTGFHKMRTNSRGRPCTSRPFSSMNKKSWQCESLRIFSGKANEDGLWNEKNIRRQSHSKSPSPDLGKFPTANIEMDYIPVKSLPLKEKPLKHPHSYQILQKTMKNLINSKPFDYGLLSDGFTKFSLGKQFEKETEVDDFLKYKDRPQTCKVGNSKTFSKRPDSSLKESCLPSMRINHMYFNDYIDTQFRVVDPKKMLNMIKEDGGFSSKNINKNLFNKPGANPNMKQRDELSGAIIIENFNFSKKEAKRPVLSARVKF